MKHRSLVVTFLLGIFTLGIYPLIWLYKTRQEIHTQSGEVQILPLWQLVLSVLLPPVTFAAFAVVNFIASQTGGMSEAFSTASNVGIFIFGIIGVIAFVVVPLVWFYRYAKALHAASGGASSVGFIYGMFILLVLLCTYAIWMVVAQNELNKLAQPSSINPDQNSFSSNTN